MNRNYFLKTERIGLSQWEPGDFGLAELLWGDPEVTRYLCASGIFSPTDIEKRLDLEIANKIEYDVQYWPVFELKTGELIGCCGLRPYDTENLKKERVYEIGFHLRPIFWRKGFAKEAAEAVMDYAFNHVKAQKLFAGHNPKNIASKKLLGKLGFIYIGNEFYEPTGLYHPSYEKLSK